MQPSADTGCAGAVKGGVRCWLFNRALLSWSHAFSLCGPALTLAVLPRRRKETHCEFCDSALPDWKQTLTPTCGASAPAVMNVNFDGRTYSFEVKPGPDGYRQFTEAIRRAFNLPEDSELNITFTCDEPSTTWEPEPAPSAPAALDVLCLCAK